MKREEIKILLIEPSAEAAVALKRDLAAAFPSGCNVVHITEADKALGMIYMEPMDVILADVTAPDPTAIQHVSRLIAAGLLVIALTDPHGTSAGLRALRQGAEDFIVRDKLDPPALRRAIRNSIERYRLRTERGEAMRSQMMELEKKSITDDLTGLFNRTYINQRLMNEIWRCTRYDSILSIAMLDLDHFHKVNSAHGFESGDLVLKETANMIRESVRSVDIAGRYGGEEFCIIMPETGIQGAHIFAERLRERVGKKEFTATTSGAPFYVTCSIGIVEYSKGIKDSLGFLNLVDEAVAMAKKHGRNQVWKIAGPN